MSALIKLSSKINCRSSPAWTYCLYPFKPWLSVQIPPTKNMFVYYSLAYRNLYAKITGDIPPNLQVKPTKHIFGARLDQRLCRKGCSYGALNFKPENTSTKVLDHIIYQVFLGILCNVTQGCWRDILERRNEAGLYLFRLSLFQNIDLIEILGDPY